MSIHPYLHENQCYTLMELEQNVGGNHQHGIMCAPKVGLIMVISHGDKRIPKNKTKYNDRWNEDHTVYYYHGSGDKGDQDPNDSRRGNKQLRESRTNGTRVGLFIESDNKTYEYIGEVKVVSEPVYELEPSTGFNRLVYSLALLDSVDSTPDDIDSRVQKIKDIPNVKLIREVSKPYDPKVFKTVTCQYRRSEYVRLYALRRAGKNCELCEQEAPFTRSDGSPYLEVHHIKPLADGGPDTIDNVCALCPNCHRKMHIVSDPDDVSKLLKSAEKRL
jgi:5-methylcytosine-specific restriction protein A